jgi:hypothetical protein
MKATINPKSFHLSFILIIWKNGKTPLFSKGALHKRAVMPKKALPSREDEYREPHSICICCSGKSIDGFL